MTYIVVQWILWLIGAAFIGGIVGYQLRSLARSAADLKSSDGRASLQSRQAEGFRPADPEGRTPGVDGDRDLVSVSASTHESMSSTGTAIGGDGGADAVQPEAQVDDRAELIALLDEHEAAYDALYAAVQERDEKIIELLSIIDAGQRGQAAAG